MKTTISLPGMLLTVALLASSNALAQSDPAAKRDFLSVDRVKPVNRAITPLMENGRLGIRVDQRPGDGAVWLNDANFSTGRIEFDVRGRDVLQQSFVGLAFHGQDEPTYEAVYFRPFNFRAEDPVRRVHAVQYVSLPDYPWPKLRAEYPGRYESALNPAPDPNGWFHVRVEVTSDRVSVFVNGSDSPVLDVERLSRQPSGRIGLWVGNNSGGDFANLTVAE